MVDTVTRRIAQVGPKPFSSSHVRVASLWLPCHFGLEFPRLVRHPSILTLSTPSCFPHPRAFHTCSHTLPFARHCTLCDAHPRRILSDHVASGLSLSAHRLSLPFLPTSYLTPSIPHLVSMSRLSPCFPVSRSYVALTIFSLFPLPTLVWYLLVSFVSI